jgi:glycosyltransferase involved in cell wall biosynthesis
MLVARKATDDPDVRQVPAHIMPGKYRNMRWRQRLGLHRDSRPLPARMFNFDREPDLDTSVFFQQPKGSVDILMLHWITGLLTVEMIHRLYQHFQCPIVWLMMDMEPVTGGCHYAFDCTGYTRQCGNCPQIEPRGEQDVSREVWEKKKRLLQPLPITFVAANSNARGMIERSSLFGSHRIADIPVPLDDRIFRPFDQRAARDLLHVPQDARVIFFGASSMEDPRKGIPELLAALQLLWNRLDQGGIVDGKQVMLLVAGRNGRLVVDRQPFQAVNVGYLRDDLTLALAYQAADLFVCPSVEDGGPMMIAEAMMCGSPVVAFHSGMAPDLIRHRENGYLARIRDALDLAEGLLFLLSQAGVDSVRQKAREAAKVAHDCDSVGRRYLELFESLIGFKNKRHEAVGSLCSQR